jgi:cyanate permease
MAFFVTYLIAASGPFIAGTIYDAFDSWAIIFTLLALISMAQLVAIVPLRKGAVVT